MKPMPPAPRAGAGGPRRAASRHELPRRIRGGAPRERERAEEAGAGANADKLSSPHMEALQITASKG
jgi:hypothetical protein